MSKEEKPCPTCFEAPNPDSRGFREEMRKIPIEAAFITASRWSEMGTTDIITSMQLAARILKERSWTRAHAQQMLVVVHDLTEILMMEAE